MMQSTTRKRDNMINMVGNTTSILIQRISKLVMISNAPLFFLCQLRRLGF